MLAFGQIQKFTIAIMKKVIIGNNILHKLADLIDVKKYSRIIILTDDRVAKFWLPIVKKSLGTESVDIVIHPGEKEKSLRTTTLIWKRLITNHCDRRSLMVNLGGGVIGDMGGFAAGCYLRGIDFVQVPTTLLAQVDASVGGKVGIDFAGLKNNLGLFRQPIKVIIDIDTLSTLPSREYISGFAEIIKHGIVADKNYFDFVSSKKPGGFSSDEIIKIINGSCQIKSDIVAADEKEKNIRKILNFGHTIGHAIESLSLLTTKPLLHGEAIAVGMVAESKIAALTGNISTDQFQTIEDAITNAGLPIRIRDVSISKIEDLLIFDKKNFRGKILWSLPKKIGHAVFGQEIPPAIVIKSLQYICGY
jgi:3-dehydroquinate synthase